MEIKTCEQYVLARLEEAEAKADAVTNLLAVRDNELETLKAELDDLKALIRRRCSLDTATHGGNIIAVDTLWEKYDPTDYNMIAEIIKEGM